MKKIVFCSLALATLSLSSAIAADKVVVIPFGSSRQLDNVITVSASGADFIDPVAAINSISDAAGNNPYLIVIGPGVYNLTQTLVMKSHVSLVGSGEQATKLTGTVTGSTEKDSAIVAGADKASLTSLTVEHTGGGALAVGIYNEDAAPELRDVTVNVSNGTTFNHGVFNLKSSPVMADMEISISGIGASLTYGVSNLRYDIAHPVSAPLMKNLTITVTGGGYARGLQNALSAAPVLENVTISASGASTANNGVYNSDSIVTIRQSAISVSGGGATGIFTETSGWPTKNIVSHSTVEKGITGLSNSCIFVDDALGGKYIESCIGTTTP